MESPPAGDRLIFALDVPTREEALRLVDELDGVVSFYKVGLELLMSGALEELLGKLKGKRVFVDLKLPDDIGETVRRAVQVSARHQVKFITLSASVDEKTIAAAVEGRRPFPDPKILFLSFLSSLDSADYARRHQAPAEGFEAHILDRSSRALSAGCDGLIASGEAIRLLRHRFPGTIIVSPGIRPQGSTPDDHSRFTTPARAIELGADYLVVGRPIRNAPRRPEAAQAIIDEIDRALRLRGTTERSSGFPEMALGS